MRKSRCRVRVIEDSKMNRVRWSESESERLWERRVRVREMNRVVGVRHAERVMSESERE